MENEKARLIAEKIKYMLSSRGGMWPDGLDEEIEEEIIEEMANIIMEESK